MNVVWSRQCLVFYSPAPLTGDSGCMYEPTLLKLKTMKGADGTALRIIPRIAAGDYMTFGMCLLQDENGVDVGLLKKTHAHDGPVGITDAIIQKWLTSGAAPTRTYQHLIECLRQSELGALAEDVIANTTVSEGMSKHCLDKTPCRVGADYDCNNYVIDSNGLHILMYS